MTGALLHAPVGVVYDPLANLGAAVEVPLIQEVTGGGPALLEAVLLVVKEGALLH